MKKSDLRNAILSQLRADLALQTRAAHLARDEATNEESRAENKYDTRGQEAAYLAEGQARLAAEIGESIALYETMALPESAPADTVAVGSIVQVESRTTSAWYFLGPRAGGLEVRVGDRTVLVLTPQSPLGRQLLGKRVGDTLGATARGAANGQKISSIV